MDRKRIQRILQHPYSIICVTIVCLALALASVYWYQQWQTGTAIRQQGDQYLPQVAKRQDRKAWLETWQTVTETTLQRVQEAAQRHGVQILAYEALPGQEQSYTITLGGTFGNMVLLLQELESQQPPIFCRSLSLERQKDEESLVCNITV